MLYVKVLLKVFFKTERWSNFFFSEKSLNDFPMPRSLPYEHVFYSLFRSVPANASVTFASSPAVLPATVFLGEVFRKFRFNTSCVAAFDVFIVGGIEVFSLCFRRVLQLSNPCRAPYQKNYCIKKGREVLFSDVVRLLNECVVWRMLAYCFETSFGGCCLRINCVCLSRVSGFARVAF